MDADATFDLLSRWRAGDRDALGALLNRDLEWIRAFVHRRLGNAPARKFGDTDDFVQEAAVRVLREGPRFLLADREQFRLLLATIVLNVIRSQHRALQTLKRTVQREQPLGTDSVLMLDPPYRDDVPPDERAAQAEQEEWLRLGFLLLDPDDQQVIDLHWQGKTDAEIGAVVGAVANTARMRRQRATARLMHIVLEAKAGRIERVLGESAA
ncbi:MAG: sigma-70 family RNA polymerase sigma factor [Planctomycetota bacterium]